MKSAPSQLRRRSPAGDGLLEKKSAQPDVVRTEPLYDQIYEILWQKILNLEITAGTRLRDVEWAEKLNVSRTPVREALRKLQKDGMLQALSNGRYILKRIDSTELRQLYRCRAVLEGLAMRDLAGKITTREMAKLQTLMAETRISLDRKDFRAVFRQNTEFHERLTRLSGNTYLLALLENLRRLILYSRASLRTVIDVDGELGDMYSRQMQCSQEHHDRIMQAIVDGDYESAASQMEKHLFETAEDMCVILDRATAGLEQPV